MEEETRKDKPNRVDELIREIKAVRTANSGLHIKVNSLESHIYSKNCEVKTLENRVDRAASRIQFLESERTCLLKKYSARIRNLENEKRKNDIFNQKVMATSKTKKESLMMQEMDSLRAVNRTLLGIINLLGEQMGFDGNILKMMAEIADGVEDNILRLFLDGLKVKDAKPVGSEVVLCDIDAREKSLVKNDTEA